MLRSCISPLRSFPLILALVLVVLAACAPVTPVPVQTTASPEVVDTPPVETVEALEPQPGATVTSRGNDLVATDPSTVQLAAGQLQLVEFFRFT